MENQRKCSLNEHKEINAINYCTKCNIYMCNKCLKFHSEIFKNHSLINLEKENGDIFIDICKEENHQNKLEFFCKNHNTLCCVACISKIKKDKYGQHFNCEVYNIEEIKEEKKSNLRTNIDYLDNLSHDLDNSIKELKEMLEKINNNGEKVKLKIQKIFTTIRNEINNREDELLLEVDKQLNKLFFNEEFVKNAEKLPNNIKISLNKGRKTEERWNDNELGLLINNCIKIEKNIEEINKINEKIHNYNTMNDIEVKFSPPNEFKLDNILEIIQNYGKVFYNNIKYSFLKIKNSDSINLNINKGTREKDQTIIPELYIPKIGGGIDINGPKIGGGLDIHGPQIGRGIDIHGPGLDIHGPQIGRGIDIHGP